MNKGIRDKKSFSSFLNNDRKKNASNITATKDGGADESRLGGSPTRRKGQQVSTMNRTTSKKVLTGSRIEQPIGRNRNRSTLSSVKT